MIPHAQRPCLAGLRFRAQTFALSAALLLGWLSAPDEFAHNIHLRGMVRVDATFDSRLKKTFTTAMEDGLWKGKYASANHHEYFAEGVQSWFDNNRVNDHDHNHVNTRALLIEYAETTEAFFSRNDFFPFTRVELKKHDPEMEQLLGKLWGATK